MLTRIVCNGGAAVAQSFNSSYRWKTMSKVVQAIFAWSFFTSFVLSSCIHQQPSDVDKVRNVKIETSISFAKIGDLVIELDSLTPFGREISIYNLPQSDSIILLNHANKSIDVISLSDGEVKNKISYRDERFQNLNLSGIIPISLDSLWLLGKFRANPYYLLDYTNNNWKTFFTDSNPTSKAELANPILTSTLMGYALHKALWFVSWPLTSFAKEWPPSSIASIDIKNEKYISKQIPFPSVYKNFRSSDELVSLGFALLIKMPNQDSFLVFYPASDEFYFYNMDLELIGAKRIECSLGSIEKWNKGIESKEPVHYQYNLFMLSTENVFLRFISKALPPSITGEDEENTDRILQIVDMDLNEIVVFELPKNIFDLFRSFTVGNKLYLSTNHYENPNLDEDKLVFEIYDIDMLIDRKL